MVVRDFWGKPVNSSVFKRGTRFAFSRVQQILQQQTLPIQHGVRPPPSAPALPWWLLSAVHWPRRGERFPQKCYIKCAHLACTSTQAHVLPKPSTGRLESSKQPENLAVPKWFFFFTVGFDPKRNNKGLREQSQASCWQHSRFCKNYPNGFLTVHLSLMPQQGHSLRSHSYLTTSIFI